jgi:response regulator RpfG family c-di-GMP phosphodiesterase
LGKGTRVTVKIPFDQTNENFIADNTRRKSKPESIVPNYMGQTDSEKLVNTDESGCSNGNGSTEHGNEMSLLIVEDNTDLLDYVAGILSDEYKIWKAKNGKEGLNIAVKCIPDIIISDIMMPEMDGMQMCEELKNNPYTSHIPILLLTAKTDQDSILQGYKTGADDYIIKPFSAVLLKSRVQNLVNQRRKLIDKFSQQFQVEPTAIILPDADKNFLEKCIQVIEKYIDNPDLDIDILAAEMNVSRTQLYRKLKALTDYSGNRFIRVIRLKRAAQLLSQNQLTISEVMLQTGFSNYSYFNQCFKEQFNSFPKDYHQFLNQAN